MENESKQGSHIGVAEGQEVWHLRLYVAGTSRKSLRALANLKNLCEEHLAGHYKIEIVDLVEHPSLARDDDILAIPTLVCRLPPPSRKIIGDLSDTERVLVGLRGSAAVAMTAPHDSTVRRFEDGLAALDETCYELTLFVSGASELSARAIANARRLCDIHLAGRYHLTVIDVHEDPAAVISNRVVAAPTLVKNRPLPVRKLVGDLSQTVKVLLALELPVADEPPRALR